MGKGLATVPAQAFHPAKCFIKSFQNLAGGADGHLCTNPGLGWLAILRALGFRGGGGGGGEGRRAGSVC